MRIRKSVVAGIAGGLAVGVLIGWSLGSAVPDSSRGTASSPVTTLPTTSSPAASVPPSEGTQPATPDSDPSDYLFPTAGTTGVPNGWVPAKELTGEQTVWDDGAVIEDLRLTNGVLLVRAANVTIRRVEFVGSRVVNDYGRDCFNGLQIEDSSFLRGREDEGQPVVHGGGYTLSRVKIDGPSEGVRITEERLGCDPVLIEDSWIRVEPPENCAAEAIDWHGDGLQGYRGNEVTVRNSAIELVEVAGCSGTAAFFYPDQGNQRATVEHVLLAGGGYVFSLGTPGTVSGLKIMDGSWTYRPVDVLDCSQVEWGTGNEVVALGPDGVLRGVSPLECMP